MSMRPSAAPASGASRAELEQFASDVEYYLTLTPKQLPSQYLYDALGSALFDAICELPWYRITQTEMDLLARRGREIFARVHPVGTLVELGPGSGDKLATLIELRERLGLAAEETLAVGDGANDIEMMKAAGLGVAYHAKPHVAAAGAARIDHGDLTALLFAQGYREGDFVKASSE